MANEFTTNYNFYIFSKRFIDNKGFLPYWHKMEEFYQGKQHTSIRDEIPRAMTNICALDVESKASKINGTPFALNFQIFDNAKSTLKLQRFDKYISTKLRENEFNFQASRNAFVYGTEITYYRWDEDYTYLTGKYEGGIVGEHIDVSKFRVANPTLNSIQKQEWVMIINEEQVRAVRNICKDEKKKALIVPDGWVDQEDNKVKQEEIEHKLVTTYTRFFRIDGEVYYQISTKDVEVTEPIPLNPELKAKKIKFNSEVNEEEKTLPDYEIDTEDEWVDIKPTYAEKKGKKFSLYPFALFTPRQINNCFYGKSDIEELIPNQKIINFLDSMIAMDAQNSGWSKYVVKKNALQGQKINNKPGQVLIDNTQGAAGAFGIKKLEGTPMNTSIINFNDAFINRTRNIYGMSEVFTGDNMSRDLSGYAIQLLQEQSNTQIEQTQRLFWAYCVDKAYIRLMYYRFYFEETQFFYELDDAEFEEETQARQTLIQNDRQQGKIIPMSEYPEPKRVHTEKFSPSEIEDEDFDIAIEAGRGIKYSEIVVADMVNTLFMNGNFSQMDTHHLEAYMKLQPLMPDSFKSDFKVLVDKQRKDEISQYQAALQQAQQQMEQIAQYVQSLENKLGVTSEYTKNLEKEFSNKINVQNEIIKMQGEELAQKQKKTSSSGKVDIKASDYAKG